MLIGKDGKIVKRAHFSEGEIEREIDNLLKDS